MNDKLISHAVVVITAIIGVAIVAVLVSKTGNTSGVLSAGGSSLRQALCVAMSPITGGGNCGGYATSKLSF